MLFTCHLLLDLFHTAMFVGTPLVFVIVPLVFVIVPLLLMLLKSRIWLPVKRWGLHVKSECGQSHPLLEFL